MHSKKVKLRLYDCVYMLNIKVRVSSLTRLTDHQYFMRLEVELFPNGTVNHFILGIVRLLPFTSKMSSLNLWHRNIIGMNIIFVDFINV